MDKKGDAGANGGDRPESSRRPVAHDSPAFIAPAIDVRRVVALVEGGSLADLEKATALALSLPIPSRPWKDEGILRADPDQTLTGSPYKQGALGEDTVRQSSRDLLVRTLFSIGPLVHAPDVATDRPAADRVLLGRARAIRFRIALQDLWPEELEPRSRKTAIDPRLALALDSAVLVMIADGMETDGERPSPNDGPTVSVLLRDLRARFPELQRGALKDAAVTAFARSTLFGFDRALKYLETEAASQPLEDRVACFETAKRVSSLPAINDHRVVALGGLRRALGV